MSHTSINCNLAGILATLLVQTLGLGQVSHNTPGWVWSVKGGEREEEKRGEEGFIVSNKLCSGGAMERVGPV